MVTETPDGLELELSVTERKLARDIARLELRITKMARKWETDFARLNPHMEKTFRTADRAANGFARGGLRNVSLQLSQVAQQGAVTGDWVRALAIQLPDMALGFGVAGIAIGAVAGVLGPMIIDMIRTGDEAMSLEEQMTALAKAVDTFQTAAKEGARGILDLREEFGPLAEEAKLLIEIQRRMAEIAAQRATTSAFAGIGSELGVSRDDLLGMTEYEVRNATQTIERLQQAYNDLYNTELFDEQEIANATSALNSMQEQIDGLRDVEEAVARVSDNLGITSAEAREVVAMLAQLNVQAPGTMAYAETAADLANYLDQVAMTTGEASDETEALISALLDAATAALEVAAVDVASGIAAAADEAVRLEQNLLNAISARNRLASGYESGGGVAGGRGSVVPNRTDSALAAGGGVNVDELDDALQAGREAARGRRGGGGGGRGADEEHNRLLRERDRILKDLQTSAERYAEEQADLDALLAMGAISADDHAAALGRLRIEMQEADPAFQQLQSDIESMSDALADAIVNSESLADAFADSIRRMASELISSGLQSLIMQTFAPAFGFSAGGGGGGGIGNFVSSLFGGGFKSGGIQARAEGGPVGPTRPYLVGERGPELFMPKMPGTIVPNGASGGGTLNVVIHEAPGFAARVEAISTDVSVKVTHANNRQLPAMMSEAGRDPRARG